MENWKTKITIFLTLFSRFSVHVLEASENITGLLRSPSDYNCKKPGYFCTSYCAALILCVDLGSSVYHASNIIDCSSEQGKFCDVDKLDCSGYYCKREEGGKSQPFTCNAKGVFPDPFDCTAYYVCSEENKKIQRHKASKCDENKSYNAASGKCDLDMTSRACKESPVDRCVKLGQTGVIKENHVLFYICELFNNFLVPSVYACGTGFKYDATSMTCKKAKSGTGARANRVFNSILVLACLMLSLLH